MILEAKFSIGDQFYLIHPNMILDEAKCKFCDGAAKIFVRSPHNDKLAGFYVDCTKCSNGKIKSKNIMQYKVVGPYTIGQVRCEYTDIDKLKREYGDSYSDKKESLCVQYMCWETGVCGGTLYYEKNCWKSHEDAQNRVAQLNEKWRELCEYFHTIKAQVYHGGGVNPRDWTSEELETLKKMGWRWEFGYHKHMVGLTWKNLTTECNNL